MNCLLRMSKLVGGRKKKAAAQFSRRDVPFATNLLLSSLKSFAGSRSSIVFEIKKSERRLARVASFSKTLSQLLLWFFGRLYFGRYRPALKAIFLALVLFCFLLKGEHFRVFNLLP